MRLFLCFLTVLGILDILENIHLLLEIIVLFGLSSLPSRSIHHSSRTSPLHSRLFLYNLFMFSFFRCSTSNFPILMQA
jgi:hypothetical protein